MPFSFSFSNPLALWLLPPLALYFGWTAWRSLADLSPARRNLALGLRLLVLSLLVFALAGAQVVRFNQQMATMFVLDYSDSVSPDAKARALEFIQKAASAMHDGDQFGIVVFGRESFVELAPQTAKTVSSIKTVAPTEFTDISAAMRLGMAALPEGAQKRLVVLSDGNENLGDAREEALSAASNGVKVDVVSLASPQRREVLLEKLTMPNEAKISEPVEIRVIARATQGTKGKINLFRDGELIGTRDVQLEEGKNVFTFPQTVKKSGASTFEAKLEVPSGADTNAENNRALGFLNVQGKPRILLVSSDPTQDQFLSDALNKEKVNVEMRGPGGLPADLRGMQPYDAIVLDNVPAWQLSGNQMLSLQSYVRDLGCGLIMVGGEQSYGPGGYRSTPVEETLPVTMDIKQMQYIPGGAVAMIMHSCEFPQGNDWAKSVCTQVVRQLGDQDYAGLVVFGMDASMVFNGSGMLKVGPNRSYMQTAIRGIDPGDMPDFDAALEVAYKGLIGTKAYLKHCIILSDGDPSPPAPALVKKFNDAKITVSTIVIQPHDNSGNQNMWEIAREHQGRFYQVRNPNQIPNIFLKEAATVSRSAIVEDTFVPRVTAESTILKGIGGLPPLLGYVATSPKTTAREILKSKEDDPILATWQYGLGKSVAWTSDARRRWSAGWLPWTGYSKYWAQTVRWAMRTTTSADLQTNVNIDKGKGKVSIEAVDEKGNFVNFLNPKARLIKPDYKASDINLEQVGPGRYEAQFDARQLGTYLVNIRTQKGDETRSQITGGVLPYSPEYASVGTNDFLLRQIADRSHGDVFDIHDKASEDKSAFDVFNRPRTAARLPVDIWLTLLMIAACLFPIDVAVRRLLIGEEQLAALSNRLRNRAPREQNITRGDTTEKLRVARQEREAKRAATPTPTPSAPTGPTAPRAPSRPANAPPPVTNAPQNAPAPAPEAAPPTAPEDEGEIDAMERLRRAKRRARGE